MKPTDYFLLILAAILMALGMVPASASDANVAAVLQKQTQELMDAVTFGKADVWRRYLDAEVIYSAEDGSVKNEEGYYGQTLHARYRSTDTWIETPAGWRLLASQLLAIRRDP